MRTIKVKSSDKEAVFKVTKSTKARVESEEVTSDLEESNFVWKLKR